MNINQEHLWNTSNVLPAVTDQQELELIRQHEQQMLLIANPMETVLFRHTPDEQFVSYLVKQGFGLPRIQMCDEDGLPDNEDFHHPCLVPYLVTEEVDHWVRNTSGRSAIGPPYDLVKRLNNKFATRQLAIAHGFQATSGYFCHHERELKEAYWALRTEGFEKCVLKIPYGASGKGLKIIASEHEFATVCKFIARRSEQFELLLEGWHPTHHCINAQLWIDHTSTKLLAVTEQMIDQNGVYIGTHFTPDIDRALVEQYRSEMLRLGAILQQAGYTGVCGIDSIIGTNGVLYPIIEINARFTQVTYLLPVVAELIRTYSYISSRFVRFETEHPLSFSDLYHRLHQRLAPDTRNGFMVYTFARHTLPERPKTRYRIFVLFYGLDNSKVQTMIQTFIDIQWALD